MVQINKKSSSSSTADLTEEEKLRDETRRYLIERGCESCLSIFDKCGKRICSSCEDKLAGRVKQGSQTSFDLTNVIGRVFAFIKPTVQITTEKIVNVFGALPIIIGVGSMIMFQNDTFSNILRVIGVETTPIGRIVGEVALRVMVSKACVTFFKWFNNTRHRDAIQQQRNLVTEEMERSIGRRLSDASNSRCSTSSTMQPRACSDFSRGGGIKQHEQSSVRGRPNPNLQHGDIQEQECWEFQSGSVQAAMSSGSCRPRQIYEIELRLDNFMILLNEINLILRNYGFDHSLISPREKKNFIDLVNTAFRGLISNEGIARIFGLQTCLNDGREYKVENFFREGYQIYLGILGGDILEYIRNANRMLLNFTNLLNKINLILDNYGPYHLPQEEKKNFIDLVNTAFRGLISDEKIAGVFGLQTCLNDGREYKVENFFREGYQIYLGTLKQDIFEHIQIIQGIFEY
jgi:hypothetical protein